MARRREPKHVEVKQKDIRRADTLIRALALVALVACFYLKGRYPDLEIPDVAFWILGAAILGPEFIDFVKTRLLGK